MDLQEQNALEVANHVAAKVKEHARPWRAIIALVLAIAAAAAAGDARDKLPSLATPGFVAQRIVWACSVVAFCFFASAAVVGLAQKSRRVVETRAGSDHASVVRYLIMLVGAIIILLSTLALLRVEVGQLILGGAVTTILIGIAAQQSLGNVFAGLVLLLSRPFAVGDSLLLRSGQLGGQVEGIVTEIGLIYLRLDTADGVMQLPNAQVLAAGVGRVRPPVPEPREPEPPDSTAVEVAGPGGTTVPGGMTGPGGVTEPGGTVEPATVPTEVLPPPGAPSSGAPSGDTPSGDAPSAGAAPPTGGIPPAAAAVPGIETPQDGRGSPDGNASAANAPGGDAAGDKDRETATGQRGPSILPPGL